MEIDFEYLKLNYSLRIDFHTKWVKVVRRRREKERGGKKAFSFHSIIVLKLNISNVIVFVYKCSYLRYNYQRKFLLFFSLFCKYIFRKKPINVPAERTKNIKHIIFFFDAVITHLSSVIFILFPSANPICQAITSFFISFSVFPLIFQVQNRLQRWGNEKSKT